MILLPLLLMAAAPEGIDLDDYDKWEAGARAFDRGPAGCWEFEGTVSMRLMHDSGSSFFGRAQRKDTSVQGTWTGRFTDHVWEEFVYTVDAEPEFWMLVRPLWGTVRKSGLKGFGADQAPISQEPPENARSPQMGSAAPPSFELTTTQYTDWDELSGAVILKENGTMSGIGRGDIESVHTFPGGRDIATQHIISLPKPVEVGTWPIAGKVKAGSVHLIGFVAGDVVLPHHQKVSGIAGAFGHTLGVDSELIVSQATPCTSAPADPAQ